MPLFFTPGQFARHSEFFRQLGQLLGAGVPAIKALKQIERHPPSASYRKPLGLTIEGIEQAGTLSQSARSAGNWLPPIDLALLEAGEASGRLEQTLESLADYYEDRARIARDLAIALLYPVFLLHAAVFILPFARFFQTGNLAEYLWSAGRILLPLYVLAGLVIFLGQSRHGKGWRAFVERILGVVPVLGAARRDMALARLSMTLEALLAAGVTVIEAWQLAGTASGSPALGKIVDSWIPRLRERSTPAELVQETRWFPEVFSSQYATGEVSGRLDDSLKRLQKYYQQAASTKLHLLAQVVPWIIYGAVAGYIVYKIFQFYTGYFQQIGNLL